MDHHVKRMLKLIEDDGDSFAKKAQMYYQKRPELISLVEDFYRMYRSLAERYDNVTAELKKNIPSDLQSQGSGISDVGSEPPSATPSSEQRRGRRKSGTRAAGFDFFLGSGGSGSDLYSKEGDESSTLDSESESEDSSSVNNYSSTQSNDEEQGLRRRIVELKVELREVKERFQMQREEISDGSFKKLHDENDVVNAKIATYEEELRVAKEKIHRSGEEISCLKIELQKYKSLGDSNNSCPFDAMKDVNTEALDPITVAQNQVRDLQGSINGPTGEVLEQENKIHTLQAEFRIAREKLHLSEEEVARLRQEITSKGALTQNVQDQLKSATKEISAWKNKLEKEKREVSKLLDRIVRYKNNLSDRDQEIRGLKEAISNANKSLSEENEQLQAEITRMLKERTYLEDNLKEMDLRCQFLEDDVRRIKAGKAEMETIFEAQIQQLNVDIDERNDRLQELNNILDGLKRKHDMLLAEKDDLNAKIAALAEEIGSKEDLIDQISRQLHQQKMEHAELISGAERAHHAVEELSSRVKELETEVDRQHEIIHEGAEGKREAIRQLCFSLEHYRIGYHQLRRAVIGHKRLPVTVL